MGDWFEAAGSVCLSIACVIHMALGSVLILNSDGRQTTFLGIALICGAAVYAFGAGFGVAMHIANNNIRRSFRNL